MNKSAFQDTPASNGTRIKIERRILMEKGIPIVPRNRYTKSRQDFRKVRQFFFFTFVSSDVKYIYICVFSCNSLVALLSSVLRPARSFCFLIRRRYTRDFHPLENEIRNPRNCVSPSGYYRIFQEMKRKEKKRRKKKKKKQRGSTFKSFFLTFSLCVTTIRKRCTRAHTPAGPGKK